MTTPTPQEWNEAHPGRLDRVSVMRLLLKLKRDISLAANQYMFELNDKMTRDSLAKTVSSYLNEIKLRRGCEDFGVVCDESNNPPSAVDNGELNVDVFIKPKCGVEFIRLEVKTGRSDFDREFECAFAPPVEPPFEQPENRLDRPKKLAPIIIPMIRQIMPKLIAADLCEVQPMTGPVGEIFVMKPKYTPRWNGMIAPLAPRRTDASAEPVSTVNRVRDRSVHLPLPVKWPIHRV